jgi:hypothetical protein
VEKYVELIVSSHDESCLWRQRGCDGKSIFSSCYLQLLIQTDTIFKLPLTHAPTTLESLRERYDELLARKANLPYSFNIRTPSGFDYDTVLNYLPKNFFASATETDLENASTPAVNKVAFTMALFGWQGQRHERLGDQLDALSCQACFRNLGLWLFKSKEVNNLGEEVVRAPMSYLDTVEEHRDYCPWRNAVSQNGLKAASVSESTAVPGWKVAIRVLKNDYYLRTGKDPKQSIAEVAKPVDDQASEFGSILDDAEEVKVRDEKDKERWARLRRVKSLFDTKNKRKSAASVNEKTK